MKNYTIGQRVAARASLNIEISAIVESITRVAEAQAACRRCKERRRELEVNLCDLAEQGCLSPSRNVDYRLGFMLMPCDHS